MGISLIILHQNLTSYTDVQSFYVIVKVPEPYSMLFPSNGTPVIGCFLSKEQKRGNECSVLKVRDGHAQPNYALQKKTFRGLYSVLTKCKSCKGSWILLGFKVVFNWYKTIKSPINTVQDITVIMRFRYSLALINVNVIEQLRDGIHNPITHQQNEKHIQQYLYWSNRMYVLQCVILHFFTVGLNPSEIKLSWMSYCGWKYKFKDENKVW